MVIKISWTPFVIPDLAVAFSIMNATAQTDKGLFIGYCSPSFTLVPFPYATVASSQSWPIFVAKLSVDSAYPFSLANHSATYCAVPSEYQEGIFLILDSLLMPMVVAC